MNCKPGDLALVIGGRNPLNYGCIVKVLAFDGRKSDGATWFVSGLRDGNPRARDHVLVPLRDSDGEDEILRIAGKPDHLEEA